MKGEFEVTEGMVVAYCENYENAEDLADADPFKAGIHAAIAHEDFQRQLRAYAAEQMRGLVPTPDVPKYESDRDWSAGHNTCRAETLANIEKWESSNGQ